MKNYRFWTNHSAITFPTTSVSPDFKKNTTKNHRKVISKTSVGQKHNILNPDKNLATSKYLAWGV